jgi:hypothetical protein
MRLTVYSSCNHPDGNTPINSHSFKCCAAPSQCHNLFLKTTVVSSGQEFTVLSIKFFYPSMLSTRTACIFKSVPTLSTRSHSTLQFQLSRALNINSQPKNIRFASGMAGFIRGEHYDVNKDIPDLSGRVRLHSCLPDL